MKDALVRIIDIQGNNITLFARDVQMTLELPQEILAATDGPRVGDVYRASLSPQLQLHECLARAGDDVSWPESDALRWRKPTATGRNRMTLLQQRHLIKRAVRDYLHEQGFIEIDMPLLVKGTTPDAAIESFALQDHYLVTSCEYQIKRMEIGGFDKCYTLTQNYRAGDRGHYHNPEFTMLEWARVGESLTAIENDVEQFFLRAAAALGKNHVMTYQGHVLDLTPPWDRMSVRAAIARYIGVTLDDFSASSLVVAAEKAGLEIRDTWRDDAVFLFSLVLEHLQTMLGFEKPVFLQEWPTLMTASADRDASGKFTHRSELFMAGVELSDGFPSLTDYTKQVRGFEEQATRRKELGLPPVAIDEKFLAAMREGFPSGAGMALGFDRMVMMLTDQPRLDDILVFNWDEL